MPSIDIRSLHPQLDPDYLNSVLFIDDSGLIYKKKTKKLAAYKSVHRGKEGVILLFKVGDAYFPHHVLCWIMINGKVPDGYRVRRYDYRSFAMDNIYLEQNEKALNGVIEGDCVYCNIKTTKSGFALYFSDQYSPCRYVKSFKGLYEAREAQLKLKENRWTLKNRT